LGGRDIWRFWSDTGGEQLGTPRFLWCLLPVAFALALVRLWRGV
jgi:hypothetical protein